MPNPLFSTYSQGENRVTASILAVFERISFSIVEPILQALIQEPETAFLTFRNQPPGPKSTPDARIRASFSYWIETKRVPNAINKRQVFDHLNALDSEPAVDIQRLLILTPDDHTPDLISEIKDDRIAWANFEDLVKAIQEITELDEEWLSSDKPFPTERERELLRELVRFIISEDLVGVSTDLVLVVAARKAILEYLQWDAYLCQPNRSFQPTKYMAFYANGRIDNILPKIFSAVEKVGRKEIGT